MNIQELKAEIKESAEAGRVCGSRLHGQRGHRRVEIRHEKHQIGLGTRYLLLQYAYLRGKPYRALERKLHPANRVDATWLAMQLKVPETEVTKWLDGPMPLSAVVGRKIANELRRRAMTPPLLTKEELHEMHQAVATAVRVPLEYIEPKS